MGNLGLLRLFQEIWSWQCCSSCYSPCRPAIAAPCTVSLGVGPVSAVVVVVVVIVVVDRDVVLANLWELHFIAALKAQTRCFSIICVDLHIFWQHHINQDIWDLMFAYIVLWPNAQVGQHLSCPSAAEPLLPVVPRSNLKPYWNRLMWCERSRSLGLIGIIWTCWKRSHDWVWFHDSVIFSCKTLIDRG